MELISTHPIKKSDLGFHGNLFGGKLLAWMDAAAIAHASPMATGSPANSRKSRSEKLRSLRLSSLTVGTVENAIWTFDGSNTVGSPNFIAPAIS